MESKAKLSPAMRDAMWGRGWAQENTLRALAKRGLTTFRKTRAYGGTTFHTDLTDAGRAWIVEQIESARAEAFLEALSRTDDADEYTRIWREGCRQGLGTGDALREEDHAEAAEINEAWDRLHTIGAEGARIGRWHAAQAGLTFDEAVARDEREAYRENDHRDDREGRPYSARLLAADVPYIRYPRVRVGGAELVEAGSVTGAVAIVRRALADEVGAEVARDFADDADNMSWADPAAVLNLIRRWVTVA